MSENGQARKRAYLGMPGYAELTAGAARGFYRASQGKLDLALKYTESSLLALNMNILWTWALNGAHQGDNIDYFAMQHPDIEPEDFWLDKLVVEMEAKELDVLGVVSPIKDQRGRTSTAMARPDGDTWRIYGRLTMKEVHRLPETFTSEDLGHPLLINTGLWVCRFDEKWCRKVHFTVNDRIVWSEPLGQYVPETEPEDWFISRLFHELKLKVGCTRKIELGHRGAMVFGNTNPWGDEFDKEYLEASALPPRKADLAVDFPEDVEGWLTQKEGNTLAELSEGKDVLEIGSFCGRSTVCMARKANRVECIDPFDGRATPEVGSTLDRFRKNVERYGVKAKVVEHIGTTGQVSPRWNGQTFDLVFVDGDHSYESVRADIEFASKVIRPGGVIAFHDFRQFPGQHDGRWDPGVTRAVKELIDSGAELISTHDSLAVLRPCIK